MKIIITTTSIQNDVWIETCVKNIKKFCSLDICKILTTNRNSYRNKCFLYNNIQVEEVGTKLAIDIFYEKFNTIGVDLSTYEHGWMLENTLTESDMPCLIIHSDTIFIRDIDNYLSNIETDFSVNCNFIVLKTFSYRFNLSFTGMDYGIFKRLIPYVKNKKTDPFIHFGRWSSRIDINNLPDRAIKMLDDYKVDKSILK